MKIYISGQITGLEKEEYQFRFKMAERRTLQETDCLHENIVNPLNISPLFGIKKWFYFMVSDLLALRKCTHIAMQKNWINSRGAIIEYFAAKFIFKLEIIWL